MKSYIASELLKVSKDLMARAKTEWGTSTGTDTITCVVTAKLSSVDAEGIKRELVDVEREAERTLEDMKKFKAQTGDRFVVVEDTGWQVGNKELIRKWKCSFGDYAGSGTLADIWEG